MKPKWFLPALLSLSIFSAFFPKIAHEGAVDPDHFFHLAVSRAEAESHSFWLTTLPQAEGLGWQNQFEEKEFFFHVLTGLGYRLGGDAGVMGVIFLASSAIVVVLFWIAQTFAFPWIGFSVLWVFALGDLAFCMRLGMIRALVLGILFFCSLLLGLLKRSPVWVCGSILLFAWSYHAFYLPITALVVFWIFGPGVEISRRRLCLSGGLALLVGVVLTPAFPGNLQATFQHLKGLFGETASANLNFGNEMLPLISTALFIRLVPLLALLASAPFLLRSKIQSSERTDGLWLWVLTGLLVVGCFSSPRAFEYATPVGAILALWIAFRLRQDFPRSKVMVLCLILLATFRVPAWIELWRIPPVQLKPHEELITAFKTLPLKSAHVFNMEWDVAPYIYYARPDYRFLDLLDPAYLYLRNRDLHNQRQALIENKLPDAYAMLKATFDTDLVITRNPAVASLLERDPDIRKVGEKPVGGSLIFELRRARPQTFVSDYEVAELGERLSEDAFLSLEPNFNSLHWAPLTTPEVVSPSGTKIQTGYLDLFKRLKLKEGEGLGKDEAARASNKIACYAVRPSLNLSSTDPSPQEGKTIIAVGGGRNIRLWLNGKRVYSSQAASPSSAGLIFQLVELPDALKATDQVQVAVCSARGSAYLGVALSFWDRQSLKARCDWKGWKVPLVQRDTRGWPKVGSQRSSCLGTFADR